MMMKAKLLIYVLIIVGLSMSCQQSTSVQADEACDLQLTIEKNELIRNVPNILRFSIENTLDVPFLLLQNMIQLEFTSYSGSIQRLIPAGTHVKIEGNAWNDENFFAMRPGEEIHLNLDLSEFIFNNEGAGEFYLPPNEYTVNAFLSSEELAKSVFVSNRSNYVDIIKLSLPTELSINQ